MEQIVSVEPLTGEIISSIDDLNKRAWEIHISDPKLGLQLSTEAKDLSEKYAYQKGLAYAIRNMGVSHRYLYNLETALSLTIQAVELFSKLQDKNGEAQANVSLGAIYYYMGDYDRSLEFFLKGVELSEEAGNREAMAYAYNGAGYIYGVGRNECKKGLELLEKALTISREPGISADLQPRVLDCLAGIYLQEGQMDRALAISFECLELSEQSSQKISKGDALLAIGNILMSQNRDEEAKDYFLRSYENNHEINYTVGLAFTELSLGKLALRQGNLDEAYGYLLESLKDAERMKAKVILFETHEALADLFETKGEIQSFVKHYKLYHKYKSEVFKEEQENKQKYLSIRFEIEKLQQEAELTKRTNEIMSEKNNELEKKTDELEHSYNTVSVLSKIGKEITSTLNLETILNTVYEKVNELMNANIFGIGIYKPEEEAIEYRLSIEDGKRYQPYQRQMKDKSQLAVWCIENNKEVFINDIEKEFSNYLKSVEITSSKAIDIAATLEDGSLPKNPNSVIYLPLQVKDKMIGLISVQSYEKNAYTSHHLDILKTLASYTSAALYNAQSFETLQNTLNELKVTQQQLIQSEKMASLGELTAGVAHEIQNPLNFVNNFSEINAELIDELNEQLVIGNEQLAMGNMQLAMGNMQLAKEVCQNLKANEEKINHHGKRADAIVKGMLQHSRSSSGIKEATDINALADEYIRLSYHGLRAKDKTFNAAIKTNFDESIGKIEIIPQDIGRVILNLVNNAFFAVNERLRQAQPDNGDVTAEPDKGDVTLSPSKGYEPTVTIATQKSGSNIIVTVSDNGNGIAEKYLDKIFQPFFTTKPAGQGTGLGLSLSYDIIKACRGELNVESVEGYGTTFTLVIPAGTA